MRRLGSVFSPVPGLGSPLASRMRPPRTDLRKRYAGGISHLFRGDRVLHRIGTGFMVRYNFSNLLSKWARILSLFKSAQRIGAPSPQPTRSAALPASMAMTAANSSGSPGAVVTPHAFSFRTS